MRTARQREEHRAALDRRFAQLQQELGVVPPADAPPRDPAPSGPSGTRLRVVPDGEGGATSGAGADAVPAAQDGAPAEADMPVPGRHAARRGAGPGAWSVRVPEAARPVAARWTLTPPHLRVVAAVLLVAVLATGVWLLRSRPSAAPAEAGFTVSRSADPSSPDPSPSEASPPDPAGAASSVPAAGADAPAGEVVVHVAGRVRRPGIVRLQAGSRVTDAVEAAGGPRAGVRLADLNLARVLVDGEQVLVGLPGAAAPAAGPAAVSPGDGPGDGPAPALVDLNAADQTLLETLPGVGPVTAGKILTWREEHGSFTAVEELLEIDGIGDVTLEDLAPLVTV